MTETFRPGGGGVVWSLLDIGSGLCIWKDRGWSENNDPEIFTSKCLIKHHLFREAIPYHLI